MLYTCRRCMTRDNGPNLLHVQLCVMLRSHEILDREIKVTEREIMYRAYLAQVRILWQAVVNTVTNNRVVQNGEISWLRERLSVSQG
jgi:hypothetical protein